MFLLFCFLLFLYDPFRVQVQKTEKRKKKEEKFARCLDFQASVNVQGTISPGQDKNYFEQGLDNFDCKLICFYHF